MTASELSYKMILIRIESNLYYDLPNLCLYYDLPNTMVTDTAATPINDCFTTYQRDVYSGLGNRVNI